MVKNFSSAGGRKSQFCREGVRHGPTRGRENADTKVDDARKAVFSGTPSHLLGRMSSVFSLHCDESLAQIDDSSQAGVAAVG